MYEQKIFIDDTDDARVITEKLTDYTVGPCNIVKDGQDGRMSSSAHPQTIIRNFLQVISSLYLLFSLYNNSFCHPCASFSSNAFVK